MGADGVLGVAHAAEGGAADAESEASGLFAGLDDNGELAAKNVHLRFMEDVQAGRIPVRGSAETAVNS